MTLRSPSAGAYSTLARRVAGLAGSELADLAAEPATSVTRSGARLDRFAAVGSFEDALEDVLTRLVVLSPEPWPGELARSGGRAGASRRPLVRPEAPQFEVGGEDGHGSLLRGREGTPVHRRAEAGVPVPLDESRRRPRLANGLGVDPPATGTGTAADATDRARAIRAHPGQGSPEEALLGAASGPGARGRGPAGPDFPGPWAHGRRPVGLAGLARWFETDATTEAEEGTWRSPAVPRTVPLGRDTTPADGPTLDLLRTAPAPPLVPARSLEPQRPVVPPSDAAVVAALERVLLSEARRHGIEVVP